jgi:hypothetical protein
VANRSQPELFTGFPHYSARGTPLSIRVRCLAVQPDAAPTDQLNHAGSHGGLVYGSDANAPTFGARTQSRSSRAPRGALTSDPLATCRYSRAITGVVTMAAAISPADRTLNLVIQFLHWIQKPKHFGICFGMSGTTAVLNEIFVHSRSPLREVGGGNDQNFRPAIVTRRGALTRHRWLKLNSRPEEIVSTAPVADISVIGLFGGHLWIGG